MKKMLELFTQYRIDVMALREIRLKLYSSIEKSMFYQARYKQKRFKYPAVDYHPRKISKNVMAK
jgi:hypothetical protein